MFCRVVIPKIKMPFLEYAIPSGMKLSKGDFVLVELRSIQITGIVWDVYADQSEKSVKSIKSIICKHAYNGVNIGFLDFLKKIVEYYIIDFGSVAKLVLPIELYTKRASKNTLLSISLCDVQISLTPEQELAVRVINGSYIPSLLYGVTGSGKTEVYFKLIHDVLKQNKQALFMLPEIALATEMISRFTKKFGFEPIIWHSNISLAKKRAIIKHINSNLPAVIIGTRSALFLPYSNLSLIILDEEHDASFKQESSILYNARDAAVLLGVMRSIRVVLGSATPSIESYYNAKSGKYQLVTLSKRYSDAELPYITIVNMRKAKRGTWISYETQKYILATLEKQQQVLLFINRRGYAPLVLCNDCGFRFACVNCSSWLVLHTSSGVSGRKFLSCHHCGHTESYSTVCGHCGGNDIVACGAGVERVAEEVRELFAAAKIKIITKDDFATEALAQDTNIALKGEDVDIIVATQVIAKGYHLPALALVVVIDADFGIGDIDLKSSERTYQLIHQVGGRAGRESGVSGHVILQTYTPENEMIRLIKEYRDDQFYETELSHRKASFLPPYSRIVSILISGNDNNEVVLHARKFVHNMPSLDGVQVLGPASATLSRLAGRFRYRILVIAKKNIQIQDYINTASQKYKIPARFNVKIEVDPYCFY